MKGVEFFDWKLNPDKPFSYLLMDYPDHLSPRSPDMHSALHFGLAVSGEQIGRFSGKTVCTAPGEFYLTAPWEPHYTVSVAANHQLLLINIDWESLQNTFFTGKDKLESLFLMTPDLRMKHLNRRLHESPAGDALLKTVMLPEGDEKDLRLWNLIQQIFISVLPAQKEVISGGEGDYQRLLPALKALSHILLSVEAAAEKCHLSPGYFSVLFKKQFGMSFGRYERNFRLNGAEHALRRGATLKEAADFWGFCDKSHLSRLLKERQKPERISEVE